MSSEQRTWREFGDYKVTVALDLMSHFDGRKTYHFNAGPVSFQPHLGSEFSYKEILYLRMGLTDVYTDSDSRFYASPTVGTGFRVSKLFIDYAFNSFAGITADLGTTHRVSAKFSF